MKKRRTRARERSDGARSATAATFGRFATSLLAAACGCRAAAPQCPTTDLLRENVGHVVEEARAREGFAGMSVAIMRGNHLLLAEGYGEANRETGVPATADTIYEIGSITKQITAAAVLNLVEAGQISLDAPISTYLESYPATSPPVRIRHMLGQTSGLPEYTDIPENREHMRNARLTIPLAIEALGRQPLLYEPDSWWSYSNSNYLVLGAIVERVAGEELGKHFARTFFEPLGMKHSSLCSSMRGDAHAVGYRTNGDALVPMTFVEGTGLFSGSGGVCTTVVDAATWARALFDGRVVSRASLRSMTTSRAVTAGFTAPYGFGLSLVPAAGEQAVWHTGVSEGFTSALIFLPTHDTIVALATNHHHALLPVVPVLGAAVGARPPPVEDRLTTADDRRRLVGLYDDYLFRIEVFERRGRLHAHVPAMGLMVPLHHQGGGEYATPHPANWRFWFEPSDDGPAELVRFEWAEVQSFGRRVGAGPNGP